MGLFEYFMRTSLFAAIIPVSMAATLLISASDDSTRPSTIEDIRAGLAERDALWKTIDLKFEFKGRIRVARGGPWSEQVQVADVTLEKGGKTRIDMLATPWKSPKGDLKPHRVVATYDGQEHITWFSLDSTIPNQRPLAYISSLSQVLFLTQPISLFSFGRESPLSMLDKGRVEVLPHAPIDGEEVVDLRIAWNPRDPVGSELQFDYLLAPKKGFATIRYEHHWRPGDGMKSRVVERRTMKGLTEHAGLWLPASSDVKTFIYDNNGFDSDRETAVTLSQVKVNSRHEQSDFKLQIPDGTVVSDEIRSISYTKGKINSPTVKQQVAKAKTVVASLKQSTQENAQLNERFNQAAATHSFPAVDSLRETVVIVLSVGGLLGIVIASVPFVIRRLRERSK
jgi:hypothetical protein